MPTSAALIVFVEQLINALALAGIYLLVALGITLIFGLTRIVFFAQGELVTLGAFLTLSLVELHVNVILALVIAPLAVGLLAEVLDLSILRPTLVRPLNGFIISLGLIVALEAAYAIHWSGDYYYISPVLNGTLAFGDIVVSKERAVLVGVTAVATLALFLFLDRTHYGRGMRALAEDRIGSQVLGVRVGRLISIVFVVGCALAGLAGGLLGTIFPFTAFSGSAFLLQGFAVAVVGGLGNVRGAVVAALLLAFTQTMGAAYISLSWSYGMLLGAMIVIILVRPYGLFAPSEGGGGDPLGGSHFLGGGAALGRIPTESNIGRLLAAVPRLSLVGLFAFGLAAPIFLGSNREVALATFGLVATIGTYSLWFGFRFAGIFSIAQAAFVGIGAYTTAIVALHWGVNFWLEILLAVLAGAVGATVFGLISLRASGSYFVIILFALTELQVVIIQNWVSVTGGINGIVLATPANPLFGLVDFTDPTNLYYLVFVFACLIIVFLYWLGRTSFGHLLTSLRDNELLAQSLGLNTFRYKLAALVISGACAGLGGALYIYAAISVAPSYFNAAASIQMILQMIMGGSGTVAGPLVGTAVATFLPEVLHLSPYQAQLVYGLLLVGIIILLPTGIVGMIKTNYVRLAIRIAARYQLVTSEGAVAESR